MTTLGRRLLALAFAAFGLLYLQTTVTHAAPPGPPWPVIGNVGLEALVGVLFIGFAAVLGLPKAPHPFSAAVAVLLLAYTAIVHGPLMVSQPANPGPWTSSCEIVALAGACLACSGLAARGGRILYGLALIVVAVQHIHYAGFVATLVPAWYPWNAIWPYIVAGGFMAATISYVTGIQTRLASLLLAAMFLLWVFTLHLPRVLAKPSSGNEWTSLLVALAFAGGALVLSGVKGKSRGTPRD